MRDVKEYQTTKDRKDKGIALDINLNEKEMGRKSAFVDLFFKYKKK